MNFEEIKNCDRKAVMQTYGRVDVALERGKNARAWDVDGKEYIDFTSGIGVNVLGYSDPGWVRAVSGQAEKIQHMSNYYYSPETTALAKELAEVSGMERVFFCNSGAEANECAVKIARKYGEKRGAYKIVTLENSFHGRTLTTLAATGQESFHKNFLPLTPGFVYAKPNDIESLENLIDSSVCALMMETVQGEGGVVPMDDQFLRDAIALCRERDVLLILDEVQTGIGRTGYFYSYQRCGILPDVVTSAKAIAGGLPMGACLVSEKLKDVLSAGQNGSTFGGNPMAAAGAREVIRRVTAPGFLESVREKGEYMRERLLRMDGVETVRGRGLMLGILLRNGADAHEVMTACAKSGLLVLTAKEAVRFLPPLTITYDEIDEGFALFENVLRKFS